MKKRLNARLYRHRWIYIGFAVLLLIPGLSVRTYAKPAAPEPRPQLKELKPAEIFAERRHLYESIGQMTDIPWYRLAAIDQYERTLTRAHPKDRKHPERLTGIFMTSPAWRGWLNPDETDQKPQSILVFGGYGRDGSGDGMADANNDVDVLYSMAEFIRKHGNRQEDFNIALWEYYHNSRAVQRSSNSPSCMSISIRWTCLRTPFPCPSVPIIPIAAPGERSAVGAATESMKEPTFSRLMVSPFAAPVTGSWKSKAGIRSGAGGSASGT